MRLWARVQGLRSRADDDRLLLHHSEGEGFGGEEIGPQFLIPRVHGVPEPLDGQGGVFNLLVTVVGHEGLELGGGGDAFSSDCNCTGSVILEGGSIVLE